MFRILKYVHFLLTSTNKHGVHSPFVYGYLTKCLYQGPKTHPKKSIDILLKSIPYFGIRSLYLPKTEKHLQGLVTKAFPSLSVNRPPYDLLYLPHPDAASLLSAFRDSGKIYNASLMITDHIHSSRQNSLLWEAVKALPFVTVSIDAFYCGLVFFRQEQARQHFKIRI